MSLDENQPRASGAVALRIAIVPGVTPGKWTRRWQERHPDIPCEIVRIDDANGRAVLDSGRATASFLRLPVDRDGLSVIRLYSEVPVLVVSRDSILSSRESLTSAEIAELPGVVSYPPEGSVKDAVALVAAGVGALALPHSVARLHARKDVVAIPVTDSTETEVAICWLADETTNVIEEFVGIVRGRTAASSRSVVPPVKRGKRRGR
ncbi:MAG TPA: LysR substrate-binding domain-containing protein [Galbitalea sp.]|nr:LysR substrate-binding domain-containing protein [Galbitalea sp.]